MKKEISWRGLVKAIADKHKKENGEVDFKNVLEAAGKEWKSIKDGTHEEYIVGKSAETRKKTKAKPEAGSKAEKKSKKSATKKAKKNSHDHDSDSDNECDAEMILSKNILCKSCKSKVQKLVKKSVGGSALAPSEYSSSGGKLFSLSPSDYSSSAKAPAQAPAQAPAPAPAQAPAPEKAPAQAPVQAPAKAPEVKSK